MRPSLWALAIARFCAVVNVMRALFANSCILFLNIEVLTFRILSFEAQGELQKAPSQSSVTKVHDRRIMLWVAGIV